MTRYDVLPPSQLALLPSLKGLKQLGWTLYGGTAVALQLGHRESVDFDFFSDLPLNEETITSVMPLLERGTTVQRAPRTWSVIAPAPGGEGVKLSFFGGLRVGRVGEPVMTSRGELRLASLDDLLGHKLKVLLQRIEAKDYLDIAAMLRAGCSLAAGLAAAAAFYPNFGKQEALRTLIWFEEGDLARLPLADRVLLEGASRKVRLVEPLPILSRSLS